MDIFKKIRASRESEKCYLQKDENGISMLTFVL